MTIRFRTLLLVCALLATVAAGPAAAQNTLVWGDNLPANLDPHALYDVPSSFIQLNVYDNLYRYEGNPPRLKPWLAESHTASADGKTWEFKLRQGVTFHKGQPFTGADVKATIEFASGATAEETTTASRLVPGSLNMR